MEKTTKNAVRAVIAAGVLAACAGRVVADGEPVDVKRFRALLGQWQGEGIAQFGEQPAKLALSYRCDPAAAGWGIACVLTAKGDGMEMVENDLMGVDPVTSKAHWFAITNMGETHDHIVTWSDDRNFKAHYAWEKDGVRMEENVSVRLPDGRSMEFRSAVSANGKPMGSFTGRLVR